MIIIDNSRFSQNFVGNRRLPVFFCVCVCVWVAKLSYMCNLPGVQLICLSLVVEKRERERDKEGEGDNVWVCV